MTIPQKTQAELEMINMEPLVETHVNLSNPVMMSKHSINEEAWTEVNRGIRDRGKTRMLDDSLKYIFSQNGFITLGDWNDPKFNPMVGK